VTRSVAFVIRTRISTMDQVRRAVWGINANLPLSSVQTMSEMYEKSMARPAFTLVMLAIAGSISLLLGIVGIYGVISYAVAQRRREIGIRLALGAQQGQLRKTFVRHGMLLTSFGLFIGLAAATGVTRLMSSVIFGITLPDPITYASVLIILAIAAFAASWLPAWRASAIDPAGVLRAE